MKIDYQEENRRLILNYNKKHYRKVLTYLQNLEKEGKWGTVESRKALSERSKYGAVLESQITWENHDYYLELFDQVLKKKISSGTFSVNVFEQTLITEEAVNFLESKLILLSPHEKSLEFADLIIEANDIIESQTNTLDKEFDQNKEDLLEKAFFDSIEKIYIQIQELLNR